MAIFFMFGKYSQNALKDASPQRTRDVDLLVARFQGTIKDKYVLLGDSDLVLIVDLPSIEDAIKVSSSLTLSTGISFRTSPAIPVNDFDIYVQVGGA